MAIRCREWGGWSQLCAGVGTGWSRPAGVLFRRHKAITTETAAKEHAPHWNAPGISPAW